MLPSRNLKYFATAAGFRRWLERNAATCSELWVGFNKKSSGKPSISYSESVDEALCFGWIDGVRRSLDSSAYAIRFTPRKPNSQWSALNIRRAKTLLDVGRLQPAGLKAFEGAEDQDRKYSYEQRQQSRFHREQERLFRKNPAAWSYFQAQPPWYRGTATFWVVSAKRPETQRRRLDTLIADSEAERSIKPLDRPGHRRNNT